MLHKQPKAQTLNFFIMNILMLSNCPLVESQGSGYVILNTSLSLQELGHTVELVSPESLILFPVINASRARNYRINVGMAAWVFKNKKKVALFDLIICYGAEISLAIFSIKKILKLSTPIILHSNGIELHAGYRMRQVAQENNVQKWYHFDQSKIFKYTYESVDAIITVSEYDMHYAADQLHINRRKLYSIEPCLPNVFFENSIHSTSHNSKTISFCGSWIVRKGSHVMQEVIPLFLRNHPLYKFRLIGVGVSFDPSEYFPQDILSRIEVFPFIEGKLELIELYRTSSILLFPSLYESFGLVAAEAMYCGCAVICGNTGFAASLKNNEEALILKEVTPSYLYDALEELVTHPELRMKLAANGQIRTKKLKWALYKNNLEVVLNDICSYNK